jgi:hypothetical protein
MATEFTTNGHTNRRTTWAIGDSLDMDNELFVSMVRYYSSSGAEETITFLTRDEAITLAHALLEGAGASEDNVTLSRGDIRAIAAEVVDEKLRAAIGG